MRRFLTLCVFPFLIAGGGQAMAKGSSGGGSVEALVAQSINGQRRSAKQSSLTLDSRLSALARKHSQYLSQNTGDNGLYRKGIGHANSDQRFAASRQFGYGRCGENVYAGRFTDTNTAQRVVNAWLNSSGHRRNMLGQWDSVGIGIVKAGNGAVFATAIFAAKGSDMSVVRMGPTRNFF